MLHDSVQLALGLTTVWVAIEAIERWGFHLLPFTIGLAGFLAAVLSIFASR